MIYHKFWIKTDATGWISPFNYSLLQGFVVDQLEETMPEPQRRVYTSPFASGVFDLTGKYLPQTFLNRDITFRLLSLDGCSNSQANKIVSLLHGKNICFSLDACNTYYKGFCTVDSVTSSSKFRRITFIIDANPFCEGKQVVNSIEIPCYNPSDNNAYNQKTVVNQETDSYEISGNGMSITGNIGSFCTVKIPVTIGKSYVYLANVNGGEYTITDSTLEKAYSSYFSPTEDFIYLTLTITSRTDAEITNELLCQASPYVISDLIKEITLKNQNNETGYLVLLNGTIYSFSGDNDLVILVNDSVNLIAFSLDDSVSLLTVQYYTEKLMIDRLEKSEDYA